MSLRTKIFISLLCGLCAAALFDSAPMWWGVVFSPLTDPLIYAQTEPITGGFSFQVGDIVYRFRSLDLLMALLGRA